MGISCTEVIHSDHWSYKRTNCLSRCEIDELRTADRRNLNSNERAAIWQGHKTRCAYTGEPVPFSGLHIDHVVPVSIDQDAFARLVGAGIIPIGFDLNALENLLPTSSFVNTSKSDRLRTDGALIHFLELAATAKPRIEKILAHDAASDRTLKGYLMLKAQAAQNDIDIDEIIDIKRQEVDGLTRIMSSLDVDEAAGITLVNASFAADLLEKRLAIGGGGIHSIALEHDDGSKRLCSTCAEFLKAKDEGFWARSQFDMNCFGMADRTCETLRFITKSQYAPASVIRFPRVTCENLDQWSSEWVADVLCNGSTDGSNVLSAHPTVASLVSTGVCEIAVLSKGAFEITSAAMGVRISEMFRADVDGDGEEEIVVFCFSFAVGGTLRAGQVSIAKPRSSDNLLCEVQ